MIGMYCRSHHNSGKSLCENCEKLKNYSGMRLDKCPYGEDKPVCSECQTHCYKSDMREQIRTVMRWAGPRMILRHPVLAIDHLIKLKLSS